jgi:carbamoyltransferase
VLFKNIAASVQQKLEEDYDSVLAIVRKKFPDYENLILTGGCALNCTNNARLYYQNQFKKIYIPPFPGDESISFGLAHYLKYKDNPSTWKKVSREEQAAYLGSKVGAGFDAEIEKEFSVEGFDLKKSLDVFSEAAELLEGNRIIAWFQGRSESGPRALGNRSILARPDSVGLKDHLNKNVKFRESFRPYGCSVLHSKAHHYFEVEEGFDNPFMSFAIKVKDEYKDKLKEVSHIDQTSRMQTVRVGQNEKFYRLIETFGDKTGLYCLLNTSLNVMDEPILETVADAKRFMEKSPIQYLVIGDYVVTKK